ncbi:hypothetical protein KKG83_04745 [Candidatus Micrarchaeota archaeon]|nr:hypothetical protein [Candidatus Micrarchaeota archaeon]MBU2476753.1 hypothetical protein [Candidatus Micrarchaeota archaeon]
MAVLVCDSCGGKVQSNRCHGKPMVLTGNTLKCETCDKTVEVNYCCGNPMHEHHEHKHEEHKH